MKCFSVAFCVTALLFAGCAGTKPLLSVAPESRAEVRFANPKVAKNNASFSTVTGREGRKLVSDGLLGGVIGETIGIVSDANGKDVMTQIRNVTGNFEATLIAERFHQKLSAAGIQIVEDTAQPNLELEVRIFGLREAQRGLFVPYVFVEAKLITADGKQLWWAGAQSVGIVPRRKQEFELRPELYNRDFVDVADDLSRQLIEGPIRSIR